MPGVLQIEAMAQVGGVILTLLPGMKGKFFAFGGIDKVRFSSPRSTRRSINYDRGTIIFQT